MTSSPFTLFSVLAMSVLAAQANAAKLEDIAPYPKADAGQVRQVIHLPAKPQEQDFKVEILAGKTLPVTATSNGSEVCWKRKASKAGATRSTAWRRSVVP